MHLLSAPFVWDADPVLFHFGSVPVRWYTVMLLLSVVVADRVITRLLRHYDLPKEHAGPLVIYTLAFAVVGGHIGHVVFYEPQELIANPARIFQVGKGLASHAAAIGGVLGAVVMAKRYKVDALRYADIATLGFFFGIPLIRIGNFFNSEIYGRTTDLPWGVVFVRRGLTEPRHPSQLYEAVLGIAFLACAFWLFKRSGDRFKPGFWMYFMPGAYCVTRFVIEFVKEYQVLDPSFPLTMGQILSAVVTMFCGVMIWRQGLHRRLPEGSSEQV